MEIVLEGERVIEGLAETVLDGECDRVTEREIEGEGVPDWVPVLEGVMLGLDDGVGNGTGELEGEGAIEGEGVPIGVGLFEGVGVLEGVWVGAPEGDGEGVGLGEGGNWQIGEKGPLPS